MAACTKGKAPLGFGGSGRVLKRKRAQYRRTHKNYDSPDSGDIIFKTINIFKKSHRDFASNSAGNIHFMHVYINTNQIRIIEHLSV